MSQILRKTFELPRTRVEVARLTRVGNPPWRGEYGEVYHSWEVTVTVHLAGAWRQACRHVDITRGQAAAILAGWRNQGPELLEEFEDRQSRRRAYKRQRRQPAADEA